MAMEELSFDSGARTRPGSTECRRFKLKPREGISSGGAHAATLARQGGFAVWMDGVPVYLQLIRERRRILQCELKGLATSAAAVYQ